MDIGRVIALIGTLTFNSSVEVMVVLSRTANYWLFTKSWGGRWTGWENVFPVTSTGGWHMRGVSARSRRVEMVRTVMDQMIWYRWLGVKESD